MRMVAAILVALLLHACSEEAGRSFAASDGGSEAGPETNPGVVPDAGRTSSATSDGTCNDLVQRGKRYPHRDTRAPAPLPSGGVIEDGIYVATELTVYNATQSEGILEDANPPSTLEIIGNEQQSVGLGGPDFKTVVRASAFLTTSGTEIKRRGTCVHPDVPPGDPAVIRYTYENGTLRTYLKSPTSTTELTYTKIE